MRPLAVAAALFLLAACSRAGPQPRPQGDAAPPASQTGGFDGQRAWNDLLRLVSFGPRPPGSENLKRARAYIVSQLEAAGCAVEVQLFHAQTPIGTLPMANVIARSGKPDGGLILLLTHYDTLRLENFVGADDGASSSAVMLELARQLCRASLPTAVWIAFLDGEEAQVQWRYRQSVWQPGTGRAAGAFGRPPACARRASGRHGGRSRPGHPARGEFDALADRSGVVGCPPARLRALLPGSLTGGRRRSPAVSPP